jgi:hypothetical protein
VAPVKAEFLMLAGDSTFWVRSGPQGVRVRGSPIQVARFGGEFYEIYVGDDDRSHYDAVIVGQRIFRRDLLTGDSAVVFEDSTIADFADWYTTEHPDDRPLAPGDDPAEEPHASATSDIHILAHHGPYLSFEYRADAELAGSESWHVARRGVLDMRTGRQATLEDVVGDSAARAVVELGKEYFLQAVDSVLASHDARARPAIRAIGDFEFDSTSFGLVSLNRRIGVEFLVPGRRGDAEGLALPLTPIPVPPPTWWSEIADAIPFTQDAEGSVDRWMHDDYKVVARYDGTPDRARVTLVDSVGREWPVARVPAPAWRIFWLDAGVDSTELRALARAFDEAALYDDDARTTMRRLPDVILTVAALDRSRTPHAR